MSALDKCYSLDGEEFNISDFSDLLDQNEEPPKVGDSYWEADCKALRATDGINDYTVDSLLENMDERIYEDVGEVYDNGCSDVTADAKAELRGLIEAWAAKHVNLSRYWKIVGETRECKFTAEDLA